MFSNDKEDCFTFNAKSTREFAKRKTKITRRKDEKRKTKKKNTKEEEEEEEEEA